MIVIQDTILLLVYMDLFWHKYTLVTHPKRELVPEGRALPVVVGYHGGGVDTPAQQLLQRLSGRVALVWEACTARHRVCSGGGWRAWRQWRAIVDSRLLDR